MLGSVIRKHGSLVYKHPQVPEDVVQQGKFGQLKIALIADHFTTTCLSEECRIKHVTPKNYRDVITQHDLFRYGRGERQSESGRSGTHHD